MMKISVVDMTTGPDAPKTEDVVRVIRAINRQLREDFAPQWNLSGELRLDQPVGPAGDRVATHPSLRGDGIVYLMSQTNPQAALGFHERHNLGIPYGVVFLDLAQKLAENLPKKTDHPWSITLSHEAIELLADPQVNLLCKGPHPNPEMPYDVYHWFEMADAVQNESYEIDGVLVSNFLLPSYFTSSDRRDERNDFLARRTSGPSLPAFGVKPGGYVGFYDPELGKDDIWHTPGDEEAIRRATIRAALGSVRRFDRRKSRRALGRQRSQTLGRLPPSNRPLATTSVEGLFLRVTSHGDVDTILRDKQLDGAFVKEPFWRKGPSVDWLLRPREDLAEADAWTAAHDLGEARDVVVVEPLFEHAQVPAETSQTGQALRAAGGPPDYEWSIHMVRARDAWNADPATPNYGDGILIGHPDTGYTKHREILGSLALEKAWNFVDDNDDPIDPLSHFALIPNPGHGTATASVIASDIGPDGAHVTGIAPKARIVPLRVAPSVVLLSMTNLARAIRHAVDIGCDVISISMGGLFSRALHDAVRYAVDEGVILCAAAGNYVGFVVWPAAYDEAIAVAAVGDDKAPWKDTSHGPAVDISAPGADVWHAVTQRDDDGNLLYRIDHSSGTSYAVATTAGVAALWLAHHGRDLLIAKYGKPGLVAVFKEILATQGFVTPDNDWDAAAMGPGILDARRVLDAPLPPSPMALGVRAMSARQTPFEEGGLATLRHQVPVPVDTLVAALCELFGVKADDLDGLLRKVGVELAYRVGSDADVRRLLTEAADGQEGAVPTGGGATGALRERLAAAGSDRLREMLAGRAAPEGRVSGVQAERTEH